MVEFGKTANWLGVGKFFEQSSKLPSIEVAGDLRKEGWMRLHPKRYLEKRLRKRKIVNILSLIFERFFGGKIHVDSSAVAPERLKNKGFYEILLRIAGHQCAAAPPHIFILPCRGKRNGIVPLRLHFDNSLPIHHN